MSPSMMRKFLTPWLVASLAACAPLPQRNADPVEADTSPLVWPAAPEVPRIAYIQSISRAEDLGISKSLGQRLTELLFGAADSRIMRPMAVVKVGAVLFVADPGARGVHRFDPQAGRYDLVRGVGDSPLPSPVGLARGAGGEVYVADSALGRVLKIAAGAAVAMPMELPVVLRQPTGIAFDAATGRLFVVDTAAHAILVFGRDGKLDSNIGRRGPGDGEFNYPTYLWRDAGGLLYVTDSLNFRVQVLDAQGAVVRKFGKLGDGSGDAARQKGVATDRFGHIYVVDSIFHAVQVFDQSGRFLLSVGAQGQGRGEFWLPTGIHVADDNTIYIADSYNQRVQVIRYVGDDT